MSCGWLPDSLNSHDIRLMVAAQWVFVTPTGRRRDVTNLPWNAIEVVLLACALAAALVVRPWRLLLREGERAPSLATPLLASLTILPWLWAWPGSAAMPIPLQWSGAALAVLMLGWPLAVPVLGVAGISTMLTVGASWHEALATTVWAGVLPATAVLVLGQAVRRLFGTHLFTTYCATVPPWRLMIPAQR